MDLKNAAYKWPSYIQAMVDTLLENGLCEDDAREALESVEWQSVDAALRSWRLKRAVTTPAECVEGLTKSRLQAVVLCGIDPETMNYT